MENNAAKVVAIGGGTGLSTMLRGLKNYTTDLTAIVTVSDNGGGSGVLREEMNIIPPGDIRNCLVALANTEPVMEELLQYRFKEGSLKGQNFGNLLLAALTDVSGNFEKAVKVTSNVLAITGKVVPVTLENVQLVASFEDGTSLQGETQIVEYSKTNRVMIKDIRLEPINPKPTEDVIVALERAEVILLGPGSLYTSIIPNLLIKEIVEAIRASKAKKVYIANVMSQPGETTGFTVEDHVIELENYLGEGTIDWVMVNNEKVPQEYLERYIEDGAHMLDLDETHPIWKRIRCVEAPLIRINHEKQYIRHDSKRLAQYIFDAIEK